MITREHIIKAVKEHIISEILRTDRGTDERLVRYLTMSDYFIAPASINHHCNFDGGLVWHSYVVWQKFNKIIKRTILEKNMSKESRMFIGLLHDACKINNYYKKQGSDKYSCGSKNNLGHAIMSIANVQDEGFHLLLNEVECIRYHMGTYGVFSFNPASKPEYTVDELHESIDNNKAIQLFAAADMWASMHEEILLDKILDILQSKTIRFKGKQLSNTTILQEVQRRCK